MKLIVVPLFIGLLTMGNTIAAGEVSGVNDLKKNNHLKCNSISLLSNITSPFLFYFTY
jgi:hypothetical protein